MYFKSCRARFHSSLRPRSRLRATHNPQRPTSVTKASRKLQRALLIYFSAPRWLSARCSPLSFRINLIQPRRPCKGQSSRICWQILRGNIELEKEREGEGRRGNRRKREIEEGREPEWPAQRKPETRPRKPVYEQQSVVPDR